MLPTRAGVAALILSLSTGLFAHLPHQGEWSQRPLFAPVSRSTPRSRPSPRTHRLRPLATPARWRTAGPGVSYPDSTSPLRFLPRAVQLTFACIRFYESRNHYVDGYPDQAGAYQMTPIVWQAIGRVAYPWLPANPNLATRDEQDLVAALVWRRNRGFLPEWQAERGECF